MSDYLVDFDGHPADYYPGDSSSLVATDHGYTEDGQLSMWPSENFKKTFTPYAGVGTSAVTGVVTAALRSVFGLKKSPDIIKKVVTAMAASAARTAFYQTIKPARIPRSSTSLSKYRGSPTAASSARRARTGNFWTSRNFTKTRRRRKRRPRYY